MPVQTSLPWANEVPELIDELAAAKLPAALMDPIPSAGPGKQRRAAAAVKAEAKVRFDELEPRVSTRAMSHTATPAQARAPNPGRSRRAAEVPEEGRMATTKCPRLT
jgi:hypothetical protein